VSTLLGITLVFPDGTPSRLRVALRSTSETRLRRIVADTHRRGLPDDPTAAAERVLDLVSALSYHDQATKGHSERVRALSCLIAEELGCTRDECERIQWGGLLHDIGKLTIPAEIINKPGPLSPEEFELIKTHAEAGGRLLEPLRSWLGDAVDAAYEHHECWNGQGYPRGIRGEEITLTARVVAVADVFDVMTSTRSYKQASSATEARLEIARHAGVLFDERVVRAFLAIPTSRLRGLVGPLSSLAQLPVVNGLRAVGDAALTATAAGIAATAALVGPVGMLAPDPAAAKTAIPADHALPAPGSPDVGPSPGEPGAPQAPDGDPTTTMVTTTVTTTVTTIPTLPTTPPVTLPTPPVTLPSLPLPTIPVPTIPMP
jgi:putative nucleotidyltransferase with HDIG domain